uniref:Uncharacterized protein n=1 Tax=Arundo donax TaxID=35708 RepID=A0A0A9FES3_ARUDO
MSPKRTLGRRRRLE